ncbi:MAG TPA: M15 family metallopeptidase [Tissierellia bacterium]|nr:M15 family metallopeptidase [Tissierellia bacterium]
MNRKWLLLLMILALLSFPVFSLSRDEMKEKLGDDVVYADTEMTLWRLPLGFDGRELFFSMGDMPAVSGLVAKGEGEDGIVLSWESVEGASYYSVFYLEGDAWLPLAKTETNTYTDVSAPNKEVRSYRIAAHSHGDDRVQSSFLSEETKAARLEPIEDLDVSTHAGDVYLKWTPVPGAKGYIIYKDDEELRRTDEESMKIDEEGLEEEHSYTVVPYIGDEGEEVTGPPATKVVAPHVSRDPMITLVVNKKHPIEPRDYYPDDLVSVGTEGEYLRREAAEAFERMNEAAKNDGYPLTAQSGFRSYDLQQLLYSRYVSNYGQQEADTFSARPGFSEHQTGLVMDIIGGGGGIGESGGFDSTGQYRWLLEHAHKYGWTLRYPQGSEAVTGYQYESWHWRYIGVEEAIRFKESGLSTLEEFYSIEGGDYIE